MFMDLLNLDKFWISVFDWIKYRKGELSIVIIRKYNLGYLRKMI